MLASADILERLASLQAEGNGKQRPGLFPSTRSHNFLPYQRDDENIFFSASIVWILQEFRGYFDKDSQQLIEDMCQRVIALYPFYRSRNGRPTYNFFETNPTRHFPHGWLIHRLRKFRVADDVDDTALIYLTKPHPPEEKVWLKEQLTRYANLQAGHIRHNLPHYRSGKIYSTFFGKNMYIEFDAAVLSNLMYWILKEGFPLNDYDLGSLAYLYRVVENYEWENRVFEVAPSYPRSNHVAYNLARLFGAPFATPSMKELKPRLTDRLRKRLSQEDNLLDRLLLTNALYRLGQVVPPLSYTAEQIAKLMREDLFYVSIFSLSNSPKLRTLDRWRFFQVRCNCPAWNLALYLEHLCLVKRQTASRGISTFQV